MTQKKWLHFLTLSLLTIIAFTTFLFSFNTWNNNTYEKSKEKIRPYLTTGAWYPNNPDSLNNMLDTFFTKTEVKTLPGKIVGLIAPHAGLAYSGQCAAKAYKQLEQLPQFDQVFLLGVSHHAGFYGAVISDFDFNSTPLGIIPVNTTITSQLAKEKFFTLNSRIMQQEHSLENQLPFLQYILKKHKPGTQKIRIIPILFGHLEKKDFPEMASILKKYMNDQTLVIASTDFTHYGSTFDYTPFKNDAQVKENLTALDMGMIKTIIALNLEEFLNYKQKTGITMCGLTPVGVLISLCQGQGYNASLMDYYKSGDRDNNYELSVSYASIIITQSPNTTQKKTTTPYPGTPLPTPGPMVQDKTLKPQPSSINALGRNDRKTLLIIARETLTLHFAGKNTEPEELAKNIQLTPPLKENAGVFVTLRKQGELRGCIGNIIGFEPVWRGVRNNALKAAFEDPRFPALEEEEMGSIQIEISVMTPLQKIEDYKKIRLGTDGVVIRKGSYQAIFLPQVATETGWGLDDFLGHLCNKAGLPGNAYKSEDMEFFIFQAQVFTECEREKKRR